jgi:hypothetical protein
MLALLAIKLVLEQRSGASLLVSGFPVVTMAHVYGALGGLLAVIIRRAFQSVEPGTGLQA